MRRGLPRVVLAAVGPVLLAAACAGEGSPFLPTTAPTASTTTTSTTAASTTTTLPTVLRVAPDGSGDAPDLAAAVELAPPGGTILLAAGEHQLTAPLTLEKPLTLRGAGSEQTTVVGGQADAVIRLSGPGPFALEALAVAYTGTDAANVVTAEDAVIAFVDVVSTGAKRVEDRRGSGFWLTGATSGTIDDCGSHHNQLHGFEFDDTANVVITGSTARDNTEVGFRWSGTAAGTAEGNLAMANGLHGFSVTAQAAPTLTGNTARGNTEVGYRWADSAAGAADRNTAEGNGLFGFVIRGRAAPSLTANVARGNDDTGFIWFDEAAGTARRNQADANGQDGFWIADEAAPTLVRNRSFGHRKADDRGSGFVYAGTVGGTARENEAYDNDRGLVAGSQAAPRLVDNDLHDNDRDLVTGVEFTG